MSVVIGNRENKGVAEALILARESGSQKPTDIFNEDCLRQRFLGDEIVRIANHDAGAVVAQDIRDYLTVDHMRRIRIDDDIFFPALQAYCLPEDNIALLIGRLKEEEVREALPVHYAIALLQNVGQIGRLNVDDTRFLHAFAKRIQNRAAIMKAALFPIARVRFDAATLTSLADALHAFYGDVETSKRKDRGSQ